VTYRDETLALRERLAELETERARLEGRNAGLTMAVADAREQLTELRSQIAQIPLRQGVKGTLARVLGWGGAVLAVVGGCVALGMLVSTCAAIDEDLTLTVERSEGEGMPAGRPCRLAVAEVDDGERCRASLSCGGATHYAGHGECAVHFGATSVEYWDHELVDADGTPGLVLVQSERRAILRNAGGAVVFTLADE